MTPIGYIDSHFSDEAQGDFSITDSVKRIAGLDVTFIADYFI